MRLSDFILNIPKEQIAQYPLPNRDESRLMVVNKKTNTIEHRLFKDITDYVEEGDSLILNNTKVLQSKLLGYKERTDILIEIIILRVLNHIDYLCDVLVNPARKLRVGNKICFKNNLVAEVMDNTTSCGRTIRFLMKEKTNNFYQLIDEIGETQIPSFIEREPDENDKENFQTVFAEKIGSFSPPSGCLNFTKHLIKKIQLKNTQVEYATLHLGLGTVRDIAVEDILKHKIDSEPFYVTENTVDAINNSISNKKKVIAAGLSTLRALESSVSVSGKIKPNEGWTNKFFYPSYEFKTANALITNFHSSQSPSYLATAAFGGSALIKKAYEIALEEKYRFLTLGDSMLII
ncbi:MAG: tRNA preQ1(34) S-adenosylmethionine ribosyltransferase-isomerase QueA [Chitinophagaceae bacterium]|nr:tRNA preQ1(34) S-adenosylmethionine ribosyltransferase-isomerase QueA [Chitinophagaceae bacterium]